MIRRESYGASREMAVDPSVMHDGLMNTLGVGWPNGASTAAGARDSSYRVDIDNELLMSPPPPPNVRVCTLPLLGRVQFVRDVIGYIQASIIVLYWVYGNWSTYMTILLPRYYDGRMPILMLILYAIPSTLCIASFIKVSTLNPGSLLPRQEPQDDWMICGKCSRRRPPMAHHCRRCGQCVRKMDHHCPWINNCAGEDNQWAFMQLLAYAYILSLMSLVLELMQLFFLPPCVTCDKESFVMRNERKIMWVAVVMSVLMILGAAGLYMTQHISILFETPSIEWMRIQQVLFTQGPSAVVWPTQKMSPFGAYRATCGDGLWFLWIFPCRRRRPASGLRPQFHV